MIATMASRYLTPAATASVAKLLKGANMSSVANWADQMTHTDQFRWTEPLHFVNVQDSSKACITPDGYHKCTFVYSRDCVDTHGHKDFCNAGAIANYTGQLVAAKGKVSISIAEALKFLIHFVGDIHQPLHVAMAGDRGGVKMNVDFAVPGQGSRWNLHNVWDFGMIVRAEGTEGHQDALLESMLTRMHTGEWKNETTISGWGSVMDPKRWVQEGLDLATAVAYRFPNGTSLPMYRMGTKYSTVTLDDSYMAYMAPGGPVETQLAKAGYRLAMLLNKIIV